MSIPMADLFVSYKAEDRARLKPLVAALEAEGFSVWWDVHIGGGSNWREDIRQNLDQAKCVIVAWTERSVGPAANFVKDEATRALRRGVYLPVLLDAIEPPLGFGEVQALSLKGWNGDRADPRFQAVADAVRSRISGEHQPHRPTHFAEGGLSRRAVIAGSAGAVAVAGAGGWLLLKPAPANARRIAVLPFANLSADQEQAYFSEGVAEELRAALSRIKLEVIGRTSSEAVKGLDAKAAAAKLGVANILTGSVRRSPETIRINAQLVSGSDGVERWAQSYDRAPGDAIKIQSDIAEHVAQALSIALGQATRAALTLGGTADSVAQDLVLKAKELLREGGGPEDYRQAVALVGAAIARDPKYADAYVLRCKALEFLSSNFPESSADQTEKLAGAEADARRAMALAPKLGTPHVGLAVVQAARLNLKSAQRHIRQALTLSPDDPPVIRMAAGFAGLFGDGKEAFRLADRVIKLDPLDPNSYLTHAAILQQQREYPQAINAAKRAMELAPKRSDPHLLIGTCLILMNKPSEAKEEYNKASSEEPLRLFLEGVIAARSGDIAAAAKTIGQMRQLYGSTFSYQYALIYAQAGNKDRAFAELEKAVEARNPGLGELKVDAFLDPVRNDPRYAALVRRLNFP